MKKTRNKVWTMQSWEETVQDRKLWTIKGIYCSPKIRTAMSRLMEAVKAFEEDNIDLLNVPVCKMGGPIAARLSSKNIVEPRAGAVYDNMIKGGCYFTPEGLEIFNIWRGRIALLNDKTRGSIHNGDHLILTGAPIYIK